MSEADKQLPAWAREDAFPAAPEGWGWLDRRRRTHSCRDEAALVEETRTHARQIRLVWTPERPRMVVPEEVGALGEVLVENARKAADLERRRGLLILILLAVVAVIMGGYNWAHGGIAGLLGSIELGVVLFLALLFGAIPAYQGWKELRRLDAGPEGGSERAAEWRFETWLGLERIPVTSLLLVLMALVGGMQLLASNDLEAAGLVKNRVRLGEWWRLFTAPWLHGNALHWAMNAGALLYLGRRCEALARWPHLAMVFLAAAWIGGVASLRWVAAPSIGASGGLLGLLGFLLAFETLHRELVPVSARRRLLAGLILIALLGVVGFRFIDNAAHAGGLVAGLIYGVVVFPPSASAERPRALKRDRIVGGIALAVLVAGAGFACWRMIG